MHHTADQTINTEDAKPQRCEILVIGGGPAGSTVASRLAQKGRDVVLLEPAITQKSIIFRATVKHWPDSTQFYLSETASIRGHESRGAGDIQNQL